MASHQYRPPSSPIAEREQEGDDAEYYLNSDGAVPSSSSCFCFPCWDSGNYRNAHRPLLDDDQQWWTVAKEKLMKVREATEVAAGPKWKTFIRRIGGYFGKDKRRGQFGYDSESYALNFDSGFDKEDEDYDGVMYNARSSRFTGPSSASSNGQNLGGVL